MFKTEIYYLSSPTKRGGCWYSVCELGRFGQIVDRIETRLCANKEQARYLAQEALARIQAERSIDAEPAA